MAEAEAPAVGEQTDGDGAALRDQSHVAGEQGRIVKRLDVDKAQRVRVHDAHAVGATERDARFAANRRQLLLATLPFVPALGESAVEDDGRADAALRGDPHLLDDARVVDTHREQVDAVRQIGGRGVTGAAKERLVLRIDRVDGTGEADAVQALDDHPARRGTIGGAEHGHRAGSEERRKVDRARRVWGERISADRSSPA